MEPKILVIASSTEIVALIQKALEACGVGASVSGISPTVDRAPRIEEFDLVIWLLEANQLGGNGSRAKSQSIAPIFLVVNPAATGKIQTFQNGVYNLNAGRLEAHKLAATLKELLGQNGARHSAPVPIEAKTTHEKRRATFDDLISRSPKIEEIRQPYHVDGSEAELRYNHAFAAIVGRAPQMMEILELVALKT